MLFQSTAENLEERTCSNCGADPCPNLEESIAQTAKSNTAHLADYPQTPSPTRERLSSRTRENRHFTTKSILGGTLVIALIFLGARKFWQNNAQQVSKTLPANAAPAISAEDRVFQQTVGPLCGKAFENFINADTMEARNQFVLSPIVTASRMERFYSMNAPIHIRPETLSLLGLGRIQLPDEDIFEVQWKSQDGKIFDTAFRKENGEWRLDWDHFARYSDHPWALFLAGSGPEEGEFRLLARERLARERKNEPSISIVLYAPRFGSPAEAGLQSPEFLIPRDSPNGQLLDAGFKLARSGQKVFGATMRDINPDDMIRVKVKVRRYEVEMTRKFEITAVTACHWYSIDESGAETPPHQPSAND